MFENIPLFSDLKPDELAILSDRAVMQSYPRNTLIIHQGDASDSLHVIVEGQVKVFLSNDEGREIVLNVLNPGDYYGEIALLDSEPRSASVATTRQSRIAMLSKADFEAFLMQRPELMLKVLRTTCARLRALTETVSNLAQLDLYGRVTRLLLQSVEQIEGVSVVNPELTQQDIASNIGSTREMVDRILNDLGKGGYIEQTNGQIILRRSLPSAW